MADRTLLDSVKKLVQRYITSVEQLDVLLLLKNSPDNFWSAPAVFAKIQSSLSSVSERLQQLQRDGFLEKSDNDPPDYRYHPLNNEIAASANELQRAYKQTPVKVIEAIFSDQGQQARRFADSFRFRKKE